MRAIGLLYPVLPLALCVPALAQRVFVNDKGELKDAPSPQALSFFTSDPSLRKTGDQLCEQLRSEDNDVAAVTDRIRAHSTPYSFRAEARRIGAMAGFGIVEVLYYCAGDDNPWERAAKGKSILVQVGEDQYREIRHLEMFGPLDSLDPSEIVQSGDEQVLVSMDPSGGNDGGCTEGYWWFDDSCPHSLDFSRLQSAIELRAPANTTYLTSCESLDISAGRVRSWVQKSNARCPACDYVGLMTADFRLNGPIVEPVAVSFEPGDPENGLGTVPVK